MTFEELIQWMSDHEEERHKVRDENKDTIIQLATAALLAGPISLPNYLKMALYLGYASKNLKVPEIPDVFKKEFGE